MSKKDRRREALTRSAPLGAKPSSSPWGYVLGGGLCAIGLILLSVALGTALKSATRGVLTFTAPGAHELDLKKEGLYVGVYPQKGEGPVPTQELDALDFFMTDKETGQYVPIQRAPEGSVFRQGGQSGAVLFQIDAPRAGKYIFNATSGDGKAKTRELLLVHESLQQNRADVAAGAVLFLALSLAGVIVLVKTYRRERGPLNGKDPGR
jgi:hypothetical protein